MSEDKNLNNVNMGHSSRLGYDNESYVDYLQESTEPLAYKLNPDQIKHCTPCFSSLGPRGGYGVSINASHDDIAPKQNLVDVESVLTNRNVPLTKSRGGSVNPKGLDSFNYNHANQCDQMIESFSTRLTEPPQNFRELSINRFQDLPRNPNNHIFWNFAKNTSLEAKDNFKPKFNSMPLNQDNLV